MIQQNSQSNKNSSRSQINHDLVQVRRIQGRLNGRILDAAPIGDGLFWSPLTAGPYLVPVTRWIE